MTTSKLELNLIQPEIKTLTKAATLMKIATILEIICSNLGVNCTVHNKMACQKADRCRLARPVLAPRNAATIY